MVPEFVNEALTDFSRAEPRQAMDAALRNVQDEFARDWPLFIGGARVTIGSLDRQPEPVPEVAGCRPGGQGRPIARPSSALDAAWAAFPDWSRWQPAERARLLLKVAALMRARKHLFSATMVYEAGKTWPEADGDTAEAIDFLEYYAREATAPRWPTPPCRGWRARTTS